MDTSPQALVAHLQHTYFADGRATFADVVAAEENGTVRLQGNVLDQAAGDAFVAALREHAPHIRWHAELTPLVHGPDYGWGLVNRVVVDVRREPHNHAERVSQAVWGEAVEVLLIEHGWAYIRLPDGYLGWMHVEPLVHCNAHQATAWQASGTHLVAAALLPCYAAPTARLTEQTALLPFGTMLHVEEVRDVVANVRGPDAQGWWVPRDGIVSVAERPAATMLGLHTVVEWMQRMIGVPYLWGGRTPFGYDCSGLVQIMYDVVGIHLRRDADQQCAMGTPVMPEAMQFGDLIFFDTEATALAISKPVITHVGFALSDDTFLHTSRRGSGIHRSALDDAPSALGSTYRARCVGVRRYL